MANAILTERDVYDGTPIGNQTLPEDNRWVKMTVTPEAGVEQEFAYGKISKIYKGNSAEVRVDEDEYDLDIELQIRQCFMSDGSVSYNKWTGKQILILAEIRKWKYINYNDYLLINNAFNDDVAVEQSSSRSSSRSRSSSSSISPPQPPSLARSRSSSSSSSSSSSISPPQPPSLARSRSSSSSSSSSRARSRSRSTARSSSSSRARSRSSSRARSRSGSELHAGRKSTRKTRRIRK